MATRAQKKQRRVATGSPAKKTKAGSATAAGGSLGRKTIGEVGAKCVPSILPEDAGRGEIRKDAALINRSIRERWPTTHEKRIALRRRIEQHAMKTKDDTTLAKLATVAVRMEEQNLRTERLRAEIAGLIGSGRDLFTDDPATGPTVQIGQINFYIPNNGRGPGPQVIDASSSGSSRRS